MNPSNLTSSQLLDFSLGVEHPPYTRFDEPNDQEHCVLHSRLRLGYNHLDNLLPITKAEGNLQDYKALGRGKQAGLEEEENKLALTLNQLFGYKKIINEKPGKAK